MRTQWHHIHDPELDTCTIIAPRSGHLLVSHGANPEPAFRPPLRLLLGTDVWSHGNSELRRGDIIDVDHVGNSVVDGQARLIKRSAALCLRMLPLRSAVAVMRLLFRQRQRGDVALPVVLARTAAAFGRRSKQDCLLVSLCRHAYLRRQGIASKILLGAQVPTEKMHAWVQVGDNPVLECPDVLVHYQSCVAYF